MKEIQIKYLFIGISDYNPTKSEFTNVTLEDYPTDTVAFFPNHNNNKYLEIVSFKRILGLLYDKQISKKDKFLNITNCKTPTELAKKLQEEEIYFCNLDKIKGNSRIIFPDKNFKVKNDDKDSYSGDKSGNPNNVEKTIWKITKDTKVLCFGSDPIKDITKKFEENNLPIENLSTFPHPSKNNSNEFWKCFDKEYDPIEYNKRLENRPKFNNSPTP
ncbi:hypothetical protein I3V49_04330 [Staphylococcus epidermidis]|uniref:hypothetical protein n=1 Tax=Staphylococcus TaxID=1279 RepID=UPI000A6C085D|nr:MULTISPECIES: hypothetical protein [Staphylococcus]KAA9274324.1 hypothetical protein F6I12_09855 [Staphylococcus epidermidis]MBF9300347.1 hypothetical protein [Staphylococcus epidermidis]MBG3866470.1 hypothetical protein [Staphylococcus epidermidis]